MFNRRQYAILSERYFDVLLGDFSALLWMIGQAPIIAGLIILRWKSWPASESLYFVVALASVWFGCINACREIARETAIFRRESLFGLDAGAYLMSKVKVLSLVGLVEIGLFFFVLNHYLVLDLAALPSFVVMLLSYLSGTCLGLTLSSWCGTVNKAVVSVPIAILPQIVFSKFVLPESTLKGAALTVEKLMLAKWGFQGLNVCRRGEMAAGDYFESLVMLGLLGAVFLLAAFFHLWFVRGEE